MTDKDAIRFTINPATGAIKVETDEVSGANHRSADAFLALVKELMGGETTTAHRSPAATHVHGTLHAHGGGPAHSH